MMMSDYDSITVETAAIDDNVATAHLRQVLTLMLVMVRLVTQVATVG